MNENEQVVESEIDIITDVEESTESIETEIVEEVEDEFSYTDLGEDQTETLVLISETVTKIHDTQVITIAFIGLAVGVLLASIFARYIKH